MKKWLVYIFLLFILIVGLSLRMHNYSVWPREGSTFDEFAWTFLGLSIWENGIPSSWSPHKAYKSRRDYFNPQGAHFTIVSPYLEHPPLFGIIAGGFARLNGVVSFDQVKIKTIRPLALIMGTFAIYCVFLLSSAVYGNSIGLIASGMYAIVPSVAIGSRLVQNENFFIPFFLLSLYFAYKYIHDHNPKYVTRDLVLATLLSAVLPLAKVPWIAAPIAVFGMFIYSKKWRAAFIVAFASALLFSLYIAYGLVLDKEVFLDLMKLQLARYDMRFDSIFAVLRDPLIVDRTFIDGWIYFGWGTIFLLLGKNIQKNLPILFGFLTYAAVFMFAIPNEPLHGWYRYPFYPFLVISIAVFIRENFNKNFLAVGMFTIITGLSLLAESWGKLFGFSYIIYRVYLMVNGACLIPIIYPEKRLKTMTCILQCCLLLFVLSLSMWTIGNYNEQ